MTETPHYKCVPVLAEGANTIDLAKAAKLAADVAAVAAESDLGGITVADADSDFLAAAGNQIRTQAEVWRSWNCDGPTVIASQASQEFTVCVV